MKRVQGTELLIVYLYSHVRLMTFTMVHVLFTSNF